MNPVEHAFRRFRSLRDQHGLARALRQSADRAARSARQGLHAAAQQARDPRAARLRARQALPESERYDPLTFLPAVAVAPVAVEPGSVAVVVPVYGDAAATRACLESVLAANSHAVGEVIVVDDASPEAEVVAYVDALAAAGSVRLLRHEANLGFVTAVNHGIAAAGERDVVLLNSDTEVAGDWADRLAAHAARDPRVGTVTPFSNNATICSYPTLHGARGLPPGETLQSVDAAFSGADGGRACALPTAVGFCMFVARACLRAVGPFDEAEFGMGYGEENDFCLRATGLGWFHLLAADVFVAHRGEASFGSGAAGRREAAEHRLSRRYPGYLRSVAHFAEADPPLPYRVAATAARFREGERPVVLMVQHALGSGTERHVLDLCRFIGSEARTLVLQATGSGEARLRCPDPAEGVDLRWRTTQEDTSLTDLVRSFGVTRVHVHHSMGLPFDLHALIRALGVPFDVTVHDFYTVCPRIRLAYAGGAGFCGGPAQALCDECLARPPHAGASTLREWRERQGWLLDEAARVICPSRDTAAMIAPFVHGPEVVVALHDALDRQVFPPPSSPPLPAGEPLRVALLGALAEDKGLRTVVEYLRSAQSANDRPRVTLIGFVPDESAALCRGTGLTVTGPYERRALPDLLARVRPHVVWFPALWPETYSYTLSEAMAAGLPVVAADLGAFGERLEGRSWSWLTPWDTPPAAFAGVFADIAAQLTAGEWGGPRSAAPAAKPSGGEAEPGAGAFVETPNFYEKDYLSPVTRARQPR